MSSVSVNLVVFLLVLSYAFSMARHGADLVLLLLGGFRYLADAAGLELSRRGYEELRPAHEFAMRAIAAGAGNVSELGRRLAVSKQAAAKTIAVLEARGYVGRTDDPADSRRKLLTVTALGYEVMQQGEAIFEELRAEWERRIGAEELARLEANLTLLVGASAVRLDAPGRIAQDLDEMPD